MKIHVHIIDCSSFFGEKRGSFDKEEEIVFLFKIKMNS